MAGALHQDPGAVDSSTLAVDLTAVGCDAAQLNALVIALRNAGIAVHAQSAAHVDEIPALLEEAPCDLLLIDVDQVADPAAAAAAARSIDPEVAILLAAAEPAQRVPLAAELGARDIVSHGSDIHLALVVRREYQSRQLARDLAHTARLLADAEARSSALIDASSDAVAYVHHGMHVRANAAYARLFGFADVADLEGLSIMDLLVAAERKRFKGVLRKLDQGSDTHEVETVGLSDTGATFPVTMAFCPARVDGEPCTQVLVRDLRAATDPAAGAVEPAPHLTEDAFVGQLEARLGTATGTGAAVLLLELRQTAKLQQRTGLGALAAGLQQLHGALAALGDELHGVAARLGDFEYALGCNTGDAPDQLLTRCLDTVAAGAESLHGEPPAPDFHLGMVVADAAEYPWSELLVRARDAIHPLEAWRKGTASPQPAAREVPVIDQAMVELLDHALAHDGFRLKYQPIVSLQGDTREHYSVLLRLLDRNKVELPPESFMDHAEHAGRMTAIDRWVVRNCISELANQRQDGRKIVFYVVLSKAALLDDSFLLWVCDCLREFKAKGSWLTFQFRDADLRALPDQARHLAEGLKKVNCGIALDRYDCTGESDSVLDLIPLDAVKFHPDCLADLATSGERQQQLAEVNRNLQNRGLKTIATAVEDANSLAVLWNTGVNYIQGYFLQEPSNSITYEYDA